jgi:hypothetical protein
MTRQEARELLTSLAPTLTPTGFRVAAMLCLHTNGIDECWVLVSTLAAETGASERSVQRALRYLESQGVVTTTFRSDAASVYTILPLGRGDKALSPVTPRCHPEVNPTPTTLLSGITPRPRVADTRTCAQEVVASYIEGCEIAGVKVGVANKARIGKHANRLIAEGYSLDRVKEAAHAVGVKKLTPAALDQITQNGVYRSKANQITKAIEEAKAWEPKS